MTTKKAPRKRKELDITDEFKSIYKKNFDCTTINLKKHFPFTDNQTSFYYLTQNDKTNMVFLDGPAGSSKAQPLSEPIASPLGWVKMGDLKIGDEIFTITGKTTKVIGVFPQGNKKIYKVEFSDGTHTRCCEDHLWNTSDYNQRNKWSSKRIDGKKKKINKLPPEFSTRTTLDIMNTINMGERLNHMIPIITSPVEYKNVDLPIDPYILGQLLGDGSFRNKPIRVSTIDDETIEYFKNKFGENFKFLSKCSYRILGLNQIITDLGLMNKYSHDKFIPPIYKISSIDDRISLLQGLMDSDGSATKAGIAKISSTSEQMVDDLTEIVNSLGGITYKTISIGKLYGVEHKIVYTLCVNLPSNIIPFKLSRKINLYKPNIKYSPKRYIYKITECGVEECQCIKVDDPSMLYLTANYIVTHNTHCAVYGALELLRERKVDNVLYIRSAVESASKSMGFLPGELNSKFENYAIPLLQKLNEVLDKTTIHSLMENDYIQAIPVNFVRGQTFNNVCVIADESQNFTRSELNTILTRFGKNSKFFILGDSKQKDIRDSGFEEVYKLFDTEFSRKNNIHCFKFDVGDIVRSQILKHITQVLGV